MKMCDQATEENVCQHENSTHTHTHLRRRGPGGDHAHEPGAHTRVLPQVAEIRLVLRGEPCHQWDVQLRMVSHTAVERQLEGHLKRLVRGQQRLTPGTQQVVGGWP